jgi:hypothetical protein
MLSEVIAGDPDWASLLRVVAIEFDERAERAVVVGELGSSRSAQIRAQTFPKTLALAKRSPLRALGAVGAKPHRTNAVHHRPLACEPRGGSSHSRDRVLYEAQGLRLWCSPTGPAIRSGRSPQSTNAHCARGEELHGENGLLLRAQPLAYTKASRTGADVAGRLPSRRGSLLTLSLVPSVRSSRELSENGEAAAAYRRERRGSRQDRCTGVVLVFGVRAGERVEPAAREATLL